MLPFQRGRFGSRLLSLPCPPGSEQAPLTVFVKGNNLNVKRMLCASGVAVAAVAAVSAAPALAATNINGTGSSLVAPLAAEWTASYNSTQSSYSINYTSSSSGTGIQDTEGSSPVDAFGGSDIPLVGTAGAFAEYPNGVVQVPWALTATAIAYNIPGLKVPKGESFQLTGKILAQIYTGKITNWDSSLIKAANTWTTTTTKTETKTEKVHGKNVKKKVKVKVTKKTSATIPNLGISPVLRSGGSGDSYAVESFLNKSDPTDWNFPAAGTWPVSTVGTAESGNLGVLAEVQATSGAVGYVAASYLIENSYSSVAAIETPKGTYVTPNAKNIQAAAAGVTPPAQGANFNLPIQYENNALAYPISTFTYGLIPLGSDNTPPVQNFVQWVLGPGQAEGADLDFVPLPAKVLSYAKSIVNGI
jgi:phosphate transport system substrate-binding protein